MALNVEFEDSAARERIIISDVNAPLATVLSEVCSRRGLEARLYGLRHGRNMVDLSRSFAPSGISPNATVTLVRATASSAAAAVKAVMVLPDGSRSEADVSNTTLLSDVVTACIPARAASFVSSGFSGVTVVYIRTGVSGAALMSTTLASIGAVKGTIMLRVMLPAEAPVVDAADAAAVVEANPTEAAPAAPAPVDATPPAAVETPVAAAAGPQQAAAPGVSSEEDMAPAPPVPVPMDAPAPVPMDEDVALRVLTPATATSNAQRGVAAMRAASFDEDTSEAVRTMLRILDNVLSNPGESKYRTLRMGNAKFYASVGRHPGALQVLTAVGFQLTGGPAPDKVLSLPFEAEDDAVTLAVRRVLAAAATELRVEAAPEPSIDVVGRKAAMAHASASVAATFDPYKASVMKIGASDVGVTLEHKALAHVRSDAPADGLTLTERKLHDMRSRSRAIQEQLRPRHHFTWISIAAPATAEGAAVAAAVSETAAAGVPAEDDMEVDDPDTARLLLEFARKKIAEMSGEQTFRTAAQRELEVRKGAAVYATCTIRVQLPDRTIIHGTFSPLDTLTAVHEWMRSLLRDELRDAPFCLYAAPPARVIPASVESLEDAGISPAILLYFTWGASLAAADALRGSMPSVVGAILSAAAVTEFGAPPMDPGWSPTPLAVDADSWMPPAAPAVTAVSASTRVTAAARSGAAPSDADIDAMAAMLLGGGGGAAGGASAASARGGKGGAKPSWLRV